LGKGVHQYVLLASNSKLEISVGLKEKNMDINQVSMRGDICRLPVYILAFIMEIMASA
jgi:hypothetical protein